LFVFLSTHFYFLAPLSAVLRISGGVINAFSYGKLDCSMTIPISPLLLFLHFAKMNDMLDEFPREKGTVAI
jgi:hypothetical protein